MALLMEHKIIIGNRAQSISYELEMRFIPKST